MSRCAEGDACPSLHLALVEERFKTYQFRIVIETS